MQFVNPTGITVNSSGYIYVADSVDKYSVKVYIFSSVETPSAPLVTIISPLSQTYTTSTIPVWATNSSVVDTAWWRFYNTSWSGNHTMIWNGGDDRWETEGLTWLDGSYQIQVFFNDSVRNEGYSSRWFTVDTTAPSVIITSPLNQTYSTSLVPLYATNSSVVDTA